MRRDELEQNIQAAFDGSLAEDETLALYEALRDDADARRCYIEFATLEQGLAYRLQPGHSQGVRRALTEVPRLQQQKKILKWSFMSAAAMLVAVALVASAVRLSGGRTFADIAAAPGTIFRIIDPSGQEADLEAGASVFVEQGTVELDYASGSRAIVQGPAQFTLVSPREFELLSGTGFFHIARDDHGFAVTTSELTVTDLGTRFGVRSHPAPGHEIHVIGGRVGAVARGNADSFAILEAGEARRVTETGRLQAIIPEGDAFLSNLPDGLVDIRFSFDDVVGPSVIAEGSLADLIDVRATYVSGGGIPAEPTLVPGRFGQAIALRGDGDHVTTTWEGIGGTAPRSVSVWFKLPRDADLTSLPALVGWGDPNTYAGKWKVLLAEEPPGSPIVARVSIGSEASDGLTPVEDGGWHHLVAVYPGVPTVGAGGPIKIYLDGVRETTTAQRFDQHPGGALFPETRTRGRAARPLRIGLSVESRSGSFPGLIDEVRVYAGALSEAEVTRLFHENR